MKRTKLLSLLSAIIFIILTMATPVMAESVGETVPFADVNEMMWMYEPVRYVYSMGLMNGTSDTTFAPSDNMSRAMAVTVLYRQFLIDMDTTDLNSDMFQGFSTKFEDTQIITWYSTALDWASRFDIVNGKDGGKFDPDGDVTRAEFCTMLARYLDFVQLTFADTEEAQTGFADEDTVPAFAKDAMGMMVGAGIIKGDGGNRLNPRATATRAEIAAMLQRLNNAHRVPVVPEELEEYGISIEVSLYEDTEPISSPEFGERNGHRYLNVYVHTDKEVWDYTEHEIGMYVGVTVARNTLCEFSMELAGDEDGVLEYKLDWGGEIGIYTVELNEHDLVNVDVVLIIDGNNIRIPRWMIYFVVR